MWLQQYGAHKASNTHTHIEIDFAAFRTRTGNIGFTASPEPAYPRARQNGGHVRSRMEWLARQADGLAERLTGRGLRRRWRD